MEKWLSPLEEAWKLEKQPEIKGQWLRDPKISELTSCDNTNFDSVFSGLGRF